MSSSGIRGKNSLLSKEMNLHRLWKLHDFYDKKAMVEKAEKILKKIESALTTLDDYDGVESINFPNVMRSFNVINDSITI